MLTQNNQNKQTTPIVWAKLKLFVHRVQPEGYHVYSLLPLSCQKISPVE